MPPDSASTANSFPEIRRTVEAIESQLPTYRKARRPAKYVVTGIGRIRDFTAWFDGAGALRKVGFSQSNIFFHEWYLEGRQGRERPIFVFERGSFGLWKEIGKVRAASLVR